MKDKLIYPIVCILFMSCNSVDIESPMQKQVIDASIISDDLTKTMIYPNGDDVFHIVWSEKDDIAVNTGSKSFFRYSLFEGAGTRHGKFSGNSVSTQLPICAVYPYDIVKEFGSDGISVILPTEQFYVDNDCFLPDFPMIAEQDSGEFEFHGLCSILRLSIYGDKSISSIHFSPNNKTEYASGEGKISGRELKLSGDCSREASLVVDNCQLHESEYSIFNIVVPAQFYSQGFTVVVNTTDGNSMTKQYSEPFTAVKSYIHFATPFRFKADRYWEGSGTQEDPFLISSAKDLAKMAEIINSGKFSSMHFLQTADIDISEVCAQENGDWTSIGTPDHPFNGYYDGGGHKVSGLHISSQSENSGLFGDVGGSIKNVSISGVNERGGLLCHTCYNAIIENCESHGYSSLGGVAYYSEETIFRYCRNYSECHGGFGTGGIVGYCMGGSIDSCLNEGSITGSQSVGGIAGYMSYSKITGADVSVTNCKNYGEIVAEETGAGGICGSNWANIGNCVNYGNVSAIMNAAHYGYAGGIIGDSCRANVGNCINYGIVNGRCAGGLAGILEITSTIHNCIILAKGLPVYGEKDSDSVVRQCFLISDSLSNDPPLIYVTENILKGLEKPDFLLYTSLSGANYYSIIEALNAYVKDYPNSDRLKTNDNFKYWDTVSYCNWVTDSTTGFPTLDNRGL